MKTLYFAFYEQRIRVCQPEFALSCFFLEMASSANFYLRRYLFFKYSRTAQGSRISKKCFKTTDNGVETCARLYGRNALRT